MAGLTAIGIAALLMTPATLAAPVPPAEQWLPGNTVAFVTAPSARKLRGAWNFQTPGRLWADPAMARFRAHTEAEAERSLWDPLSRLTGFPAADLPGLAEGQVTLAWVEESGPAGAGPQLRQVLLLDAGNRSEELAAWLACRDPEVPGSRVSIGGIDFLQIRLAAGAVRAAMRTILPEIEPTPERSGPAPAFHSLFVGRKESLLLASTSSNALAGVLGNLADLSAGPGPSKEAPDSPVLRGTILVPPFLRSLSLTPLAIGGLASPDTGPSVARIAAAFGLNQLRGVSLAIRSGPEGWYADLRLAVPASARKGIFGMFSLVAADSAPPPFIPSGAQQFVRARFSGRGAWSGLEQAVREVDTAFLGVLQLFTGYAGKTEDADFDFQTGLIDLLGDDWMNATLPTGNPGSSANLVMIGSPKAENLFNGFRLVAAPTYLATFFPPSGASPRRADRLVEGQPIASVSLPPMPWGDGATGAVHFTHRGGHVAFSSDAGLIERLLAPASPKPLVQRPGMRDAILRAGGAGGAATWPTRTNGSRRPSSSRRSRAPPMRSPSACPGSRFPPPLFGSWRESNHGSTRRACRHSNESRAISATGSRAEK